MGAVWGKTRFSEQKNLHMFPSHHSTLLWVMCMKSFVLEDEGSRALCACVCAGACVRDSGAQMFTTRRLINQETVASSHVEQGLLRVHPFYMVKTSDTQYPLGSFLSIKVSLETSRSVWICKENASFLIVSPESIPTTYFALRKRKPFWFCILYGKT